MGMIAALRLRRGRGWHAAACGVACAALLALWLTRSGEEARASAVLTLHRSFPHRAPADIAHRLADFSTLPHALNAIPGSWRVEEERGNLSTWRYRVEWACGARCAGSARVAALSEPAHRVSLLVRTCTGAALLPWRSVCDEMNIAVEVESDGADGAELHEKAQATCGSGAGAGEVREWDDACAATLRKHRAQHHASLEGAI